MHHNDESKSNGIPGQGNDIQNSSWDALNAHQQYTKIFNSLKDLEEYGVQLSVPEFVFIGFQSSGKTSAVSQAAKLAVGTMKHGTASRCPTRFKLISNPKQEKPLIKVNGQICENEQDLTNKTLQITSVYEQKGIFSKDIIEVRIESATVPELTFVDLPGLIKGNAEKWATAKTQLDELTAYFLHDQNPNGSYRYIPILVREPVDVEHDTHFEVEYIDNLVDTYGHGNKKRVNWREDTLFIVNKFDKQINRSPAVSLIEYMNYCCAYGETVLTIMNAQNENTSNMTQQELNMFVDSVNTKEQQRWNHILAEFNKMDDENLAELRQLKEKICGVQKMNEILCEKMCEIVKRILPSIQRELDKAEALKRNQIANIMKQIEMCDPRKLKSQCIVFGNKFLKYSKQFYSGQCIMKIDSKYKKTWCKELDDFHVMAHTSKSKYAANEWKYEIQSNKLQTLLSKLCKKENPTLLLRRLKMELVASAAINRIIDAWQCMVSYMAFPQYTDEDIVNISGAFQSTRQPDLWTSIRNIVLHATKHLSDAILFVAEMFRYKLKENADIIFELTLLDEFGATNVKKNNIEKLLQRSLRDYKKEIDVIVDKFISLACGGPIDRARILDKILCEETINIGRLIYKMLNPKNTKKFIEIPKPKYNANQNNGFAPPPPTSPPMNSKYSHSPTNSYGSNHSRSPSLILTQSSTALVGRSNQNKKNENKKNNKNNKLDLEENDRPMFRRSTQFQNEKKENNNNNKLKKVNEENNNNENKKNQKDVKFMQKYDELFYNCVYGQKTNFAIIYSSGDYDIGLIRHLSYVFWANIKQQTMRDVIQKITRLIMAPIKQHNEIISNAIQCGVDQREIHNIMEKLVEKTGLDVLALQQLIASKSTIEIPKSINDLGNDELQKIYGIDRKELLHEKEKKIKELKEFKKLKAKTLIKIYHIKNNQLDDI